MLELPSGGSDSDQFVSYLSGESMVTDKVIRGEGEGCELDKIERECGGICTGGTCKLQQNIFP